MRKTAAALTVLLLLLSTGCVALAKSVEIIAIAVETIGEDPFFELPIPEKPITPGPTGGLRPGDTPGLYGGSLRKRTCDKALLTRFLTDPRNLAKATAWAAVRKIPVKGIRDYIKKLTPVILRNDTLVRNHGFAGGVSTAVDALLQAGIGVLADDQGQPVVKCNCGNPLAEPQATLDDVQPDIIVQPEWRLRFDKRKATRVKPPKRRIRAFSLLNVDTGKGIRRPVGSDGRDDKTLPSAEPAILGRWQSGEPASVVEVTATGEQAYAGTLADDLTVTDDCTVSAGTRTWTVKGRDPDYTGSLYFIDLGTCEPQNPVPARWRVIDQNRITMCATVLGQEQCVELTRA
ncbi:hypothetical protein GCM10009555_090280 [Acrocarpospora macrocephala]|uniref:DUF6777 domain-containing protein n=1 Tax=Acrocarpospora macrocephala TaxID=150177 RepID=A0A5M3WJ87_9ACTN|nr:DUF6777 domain-containing protein [Acrocarpospora macrocephala]GES09004.1 hypothetical protein Amac_026000 [Acrocarpospora macrocephala]